MLWHPRWLIGSAMLFALWIPGVKAGAAADGPPVDAATDAAVVELAQAYERLQTAGMDASGLIDNSPQALATRSATEDALAVRLDAIDTARLSATGSSLQAALRWRLKTAQTLRICRSELWDLDHINGWQVSVPQRFATLQPGTPEAQAAALMLATALAAHIRQDMLNLRQGLASGYSAPRSVVKRVLAEIDALLAQAADQSVFAAPGRGAHDPAFEARWRATIDTSLLPAVRRFRSFLQTDYLTRARSSIGVSALPHGTACYAGYLERATTLDRSPQQVSELGLETVAQSRRELSELGRQRFGVSDPVSVLQRTDADPANHFGSPQALLSFSRSALDRTVALSAALFERLPAQPIVAEPLPAYEQDAGVPSHYEAQSDESKPALFRISLADWSHETVGAAEVTASHETVPGHHLQIALARETQGPSRFADISDNIAYVEGWANYAERLAEEAGIYQSDAAKVFRREVLGRSLVVDPGIHVLGWSRDRAHAYLMQAGMSASGADDLIDRIAVQPAQLTAYESGGLEIYQLREQTRLRLGGRFVLEKFHQRVLERGVVTLPDLDRYVRQWDGN